MSKQALERYADPAEALSAAIKHPLFGSQAALARFLGVTQPTVWRWVKSGKGLPGLHVRKVEEATGISRHALNPDTFGVTDDAALPVLPDLPMIGEVAP